MSYYLQIGATGGPTQVASNRGYGDFGRWTETLDAEKFPEPCHLYLYGWSQELDALAEQLAAAVKETKPDADVVDVAETMIDLLRHRDKDAACCTITDGIS